jgi:hypothetical protein
MNQRLLSVDFDFYFPMDCARRDWGTSEDHSHQLQSVLWMHRAAGMLCHDEPLPYTTGDECYLWDRVGFRDDAVCYVAESHDMIRGVIRKMRGDLSHKTHPRYAPIISLDAHHDAGYSEHEKQNCGNWALWAHRTCNLRTRVLYPQWRREVPEQAPRLHAGKRATVRTYDKGEDLGTFDNMFVCRSGAWVPSWCDKAFQDFLSSCPIPIKPLEPVYIRPFDLKEARQMADSLRDMERLCRGLNG